MNDAQTQKEFATQIRQVPPKMVFKQKRIMLSKSGRSTAHCHANQKIHYHANQTRSAIC